MHHAGPAVTSQTPLHMHGDPHRWSRCCQSQHHAICRPEERPWPAGWVGCSAHDALRDRALAETYHPVCYAPAAVAALAGWIGTMLRARLGSVPTESIMRSWIKHMLNPTTLCAMRRSQRRPWASGWAGC